MIIELPNKEELEFPDDTPPEVMRNAIHKHYPEYAAMYKGSSTPESKENLTENQEDRDAILRYGIKDPLAGLAQLGHGLLNAPHNIAGLFSEKLASHIPKQDEFNYSEALGIPEDQKNLADKLIQFAPELGVSLGLPATRLGKLGEVIDKLPGWGKYLKAGLGNAISQGGFAATQSPEPGKAALEAGAITAPFSALSKAVESGNPTVRNVGRVLGGLGAGGLGYYGAKSLGAPESAADLSAILLGALGAKGGNLERRVREDMLKGVKGTDYQDVLNAGERLGVHVRPSEASGNPYAAGMEAAIGKSPQGSQKLYESGQKRSAAEEKSIEDLFGNIFPKKLEEQKNSLYKMADTTEIPQSTLDQFKDNEIFKDALKDVKSEAAYREKLKGVPENSVEYLNQIKEAMDDMIEKAPKKQGRIIRDTKNRLISELDKVSPEYKQARQLAERGIVRKEIEDLFNKKDETGTNLFKSLLSNKRDYSDLQKKFKRLEETASTPEQVESMKKAQQQLEDMKLVFGRLIPTPTARTAAALGRQNAAQEGNLTGTAKQYLHKLLHSDKYDVAAVKLITNPKWADELNKLGEITKKDKLMAAFHNLLGKAAAQEIAQ